MEVVLVFVVGGIPAVLLPRFHQSFSKPVMRRTGGEMLFDAFGKKKKEKKNLFSTAHLLRRFSISYSPICMV